jgi:hypothetical protein
MKPPMVLEPFESRLPRYVEYLNAWTLLGDDPSGVSADKRSMPTSRRKLYMS